MHFTLPVRSSNREMKAIPKKQTEHISPSSHSSELNRRKNPPVAQKFQVFSVEHV